MNIFLKIGEIIFKIIGSILIILVIILEFLSKEKKSDKKEKISDNNKKNIKIIPPSRHMQSY